jgi:hypothetical protein
VALAQQIGDLADRISADLNAGHDYFEHTKVAWRLVQRLADRPGHPIRIRNTDTGTVVGAAELAALAQTYLTGYLAESVFQHYVSLFEDFVFGLIGSWLSAYPNSLRGKDKDEDDKTGKSISLSIVLDAPDKDAIIRTVVARELDKLKYKRVAEWFVYLNRRVKLSLPTDDQIKKLAEIKASRDILVHNRGIINDTYLDKAGGLARFEVGAALEIQEPYLRDSWRLIHQVVRDLAAAARVKATPP